MTDENKLIKGSGGLFAPKPPPAPYRAPDTLHSRSFATIQDLLSEGEIEGFATASKENRTKGTAAYLQAAKKDVFIDDTPVLKADADSTNPQPSDFNFADVGFDTRFGTSNQLRLPGIPAETRSFGSGGINVTVTTSVPVTRQIVNTDVDAVIVTLSWPAIQVFEDDGDVRGDTVEYKIQVQYQSGGYIDVITPDNGGSVTGRSADAYARDHRITFDRARIDAGTAFPVDIRVVRVTADSDDSERVNAFDVLSIQEVIDNASTYPDSAYCALRLDSKQFNSIPTRKYRLRGIKVKIPGASASVVSATYTQSTTVVTVNNTNHGLSVGEAVVFTATSGAGVNGTFVIQTVPNLNSFTLTSNTSQTVTTSNCTFAATPNVDNATGRIRYPSGYVFNGVMAAAVYTNCPAMCLLDLLTNTRYGLGDHITESNLDLFSFVAASKYANTLVNGEARFSCNVNIQSPKEAFAAINELAGVMRCMPIWSAGSITITQDKDTFASYLFNLSNVGGEGFNYQGTSLKQRHAVISVSYFNMDSREIDFEVVGDSGSAEDNLRQQKYGSAVKQVKAFACTSRAQAQRLGRAILFAEQNESETVTFSTSIDAGVVVRPGAVIEINDPVRAGARRGGRVISATTTTITIDASSDTLMPSLGDTPEISVVLEDGTVEVGSISNISGAVITVNLVKKMDSEGLQQITQSTFSSTPIANSPYLISSSSLQTQLYRVISVTEEDDVGYVITALSYVANKYAFIDDPSVTLATRTVLFANCVNQPPSSLDVVEKIVVINSIARSKLIISWEAVQGVTQYLVSYKLDNGNYVSQVVFSTDFEILDTPPGTYTIRVFSYNLVLRLSTNFAEATFTTEGKTAPPENVSGLSIEPVSEQFVRLRFNQATAIDVLHGGRVYVRHTDQTGTGATFQAAQDVITAVAGNSTEVLVPALAGTYLLKFQDDGGRFSRQATSTTLSLVEILDSITIKTDREDNDTPPFNNTTSSLFNNTQYDSTKGGLIIQNPSLTINGIYGQSGTTITCEINFHGLQVGDTKQITFLSGASKSGSYTIKTVTGNFFTVESPLNINTTGSVSVAKGLNGTYDFADTLDLGGVFSLTLKRIFQGAGYYPSALWDDRVGLVDSFPDWDGDAADSVNAKLAVRTSTDMSSYTDFNDFSNGTFKGRGFQFRATLETTDAAQNIVMQQLGYVAEMPSRTEQSSVIFSDSAGDGTGSAGAKTVTFAAPFFVGTSALSNLNNFLPSVNISAQNMATGDYFELTNVSGTGFTVHFKNSSNASIIRTVYI